MTDINLSNILTNIDNQDKKNGLYVVATPIGNILDIGVRALFILAGVDLIFAEDTRVTKKLLSFYGISKNTISCNEHNSAKMAQKAMEMLSKGDCSIALVTDAGTPLISDPGQRIVKACLENDIYVTSIPGPCSAINAIVLSGMGGGDFYFHGFLPYKTAQRVRALEKLKDYKTKIIILESPYRIEKTLTDIEAVFEKDQVLCVAREMTKKFEEVIISPIGLLQKDKINCKGEFVVIIDNA